MASTQSTGAGHGTVQSHPPSSSQPQSDIPVEMSDLGASKSTSAGTQGLLDDISIPTTSPMTATFPMTASTSEIESERAKESESADGAVRAPPMSRLDSVAIGPSSDTTPVPASGEAGPVLVITLLLTSGARHPYKIDEKYLNKRNVNVPGVTEGGRKDPYSISVYTLKELILREWRDEWEVQPSSPSSIRLIFFGHLLDDKTPLKECKFNAESANVVHMTVRPQDIVDEEDASKGKALSRDREGGESTAGCRCVIL